MDLNNELRERLLRLDTMEKAFPDAGSTIKNYILDQRKLILEMQHMLYKTLVKEYPCHGIKLTHEMYEYYQFDIVVKPKNVNN